MHRVCKELTGGGKQEERERTKERKHAQKRERGRASERGTLMG